MSGPALLTPKSSQEHDDVKIEMGQSSTTPSNSDVENKRPPKLLGLERRFSVVPRSPTYPETPVVVITQEEFHERWHIYDNTCNKDNYPKLLLATAVFLAIFFAIRIFEMYAHMA